MAQFGSINTIPNKEAFSSTENTSVLAHIYTSYGIPIDDFQRVYKEIFSGKDILEFGRTIWMAFLIPENFLAQEIKFETFAGKYGEIVVYKHDYDIKLPQSCFVYLSTIYRDGDKVYSDADKVLEKARGLFCLLLGKNFLCQKIMSAEIYNAGRIFSFKDAKVSGVAHGPYANANNFLEVREIAREIALKTPDERTRIDNAIHYFSRGLEDEDAFLFLWTAIEIICGNKENNAEFVRKTLQAIYPKHDLNKIFGFAELKGIRNNWLHKGAIPEINDDLIRYMQLMFLDLLRYKLGLSNKEHLLAICSSTNFNLSALGLSANNLSKDRAIFRMATEDENRRRRNLWCMPVKEAWWGSRLSGKLLKKITEMRKKFKLITQGNKS